MNAESILTMDVNIAVSLVNMKLRDFYSSLEAYCDDINLDLEMLVQRFAKAGYEYDKQTNQFK